MPYNNFPIPLQILANAPWYDVSALMYELRALRRINFAIVEQRNQALERLNNMPSDAPFAPNARFPADRIYVCEMYGDWSRKFQQIKSALSHKDRDKEKNGHSKEGVGLDERYSSFSDAQQAFWNSTTSMYDELKRLDYVWDVVSFETHHRLAWA